MDMEHLTKSQIVLLTLLVSFFTSIATGIVTVSLMDQAPPVVAQTVSKVIEKTVETVVPATEKGQVASTIVTQEKTVVVKESEQIAKAVERASASVVRVLTSGGEESSFLGIGIVIDAKGTVITDVGAIDERADVLLATPDGSRIRAFVTNRDASIGIAYLDTATSTVDEKPVSWKPIAIATDKPVLGASTVSLSGRSATRIGNGIVTALFQTEGGTIIDTNVGENSIMAGSPLIDVSGNLVGVSTRVSRASAEQGFITSTVLLPNPTKK